MRIVLDTNILARTAFNPDGLAMTLLELSAEPPHILLMSNGLLQELGRILRYKRLRPLHGLSDADIDEHVQDIRNMAEILEPIGPATPIVPHDPEDDHVIEAAVCGQADVICSLDKHLLHPDVQAYCAVHNVHVMRDVDLLDLLRKEKSDD